MNRSDIQKILDAAAEAGNESDRVALSALYNGWVEKFTLYNADKNKANLAEWQAAEKALKAKFDELTARYFDAPGTRVLADRVEAWKFLEAEGYKVSRQSVYNAAKNGRLILQADGTITESDALAYAAKHLKKTASGKEGADKFAAERAGEELALLRTKREKIDFEFARERGLYTLKSDMRAEWSIKIATFEAGVRHYFRTFAPDLIQLVGGNPRKRQLYLNKIDGDLHQLFNEMGRLEELGVIVVKDAGDPAPAAAPEPEGGVFAVEADEEKDKAPVDTAGGS